MACCVITSHRLATQAMTRQILAADVVFLIVASLLRYSCASGRERYRGLIQRGATRQVVNPVNFIRRTERLARWASAERYACGIPPLWGTTLQAGKNLSEGNVFCVALLRPEAANGPQLRAAARSRLPGRRGSRTPSAECAAGEWDVQGTADHCGDRVAMLASPRTAMRVLRRGNRYVVFAWDLSAGSPRRT